MWLSIISFFTGFFNFVVVLSKWLKKTPTQRIEEQKEELDEQIRRSDETGRP